MTSLTTPVRAVCEQVARGMAAAPAPEGEA